MFHVLTSGTATFSYKANGKEWHNWFTGKNGPQADGNNAGVLTVTSTDTNHWRLAVCAAGQIGVSFSGCLRPKDV